MISHRLGEDIILSNGPHLCISRLLPNVDGIEAVDHGRRAKAVSYLLATKGGTKNGRQKTIPYYRAVLLDITA